MTKSIFVITFVALLPFANGADTQTPPTWPPKSITFGEFKFLKTEKDTKNRTASFVKGTKPYFELSAPFDGDKTEICYGVTAPTQKEVGHTIGCVLKAVGAKSCAEVDLKKCSDDTSVKPIK